MGNVDFTKTPQVQLAITYPDPDANGQPVSQQFSFDKDKKTDRMVAVLLKPVDKAYKYQIDLHHGGWHADGDRLVESQSSHLFINSPFTMHTFSFLAEGDFIGNIDNIFLKMRYADRPTSSSRTPITPSPRRTAKGLDDPDGRERQGPDHLFRRDQLQEPHLREHPRDDRQRPI